MNTQISAFISNETKAQMEAYSSTYGIKKAFLIEEALQHHLQALHELPTDVIIPARLILTEEGMLNLSKQLSETQKPTAALKELFRE
ncbi:MAG TPA: hypothetical protein VI522_00460 [Gammaproteobacteria bacterium]|nr:hypothetical protein [Gammaproteobacteria bacterium]